MFGYYVKYGILQSVLKKHITRTAVLFSLSFADKVGIFVDIKKEIMVEQAAEDYAKILQSINLDREINPICVNIEDMLARLDEFETLLSSVRAENNSILENHVSGIVAFSDSFEKLRQRIDKLEQFVDMVNTNVNEVEKSLDIAELELNVTDYSLKGLLIKPLLAKAKSSGISSDVPEQQQSNLRDGEFQPVQLFQTNAYFDSSQISYSEEAQENAES